jgi:hypothetical protein
MRAAGCPATNNYQDAAMSNFNPEACKTLLRAHSGAAA